MTSKMLRAFLLAEVGLVTSIAWAYTIDIMNINGLYAELVNKILCSFISNIIHWLHWPTGDHWAGLATWAELSHSVI